MRPKELRKVRSIKWTQGIVGYFHRWFVDADNEARAIVELPDGSVALPYASEVVFEDIEEK